MKIAKYIWITIGFLSFSLGLLGIILPILPSFPFFILTLFCFTKGSARLRNWFISTRIYKKHLEYYLTHKAMTMRFKVKTMIAITILMSIGFIMMHQVPIARAILVIVWLFHVFYFIFRIKTRTLETEISND